MPKLLLLGFIPSLTIACQEQQKIPIEDRFEHRGRISIPLVATSSSGLVYKLVLPEVSLEGPAGKETFSTSGIETLERQLLEGSYMMTIEDFKLYKEIDEGAMLVESEITSSNPMDFTIFGGEVTTVTIRFAVNNQVVEFQTGDLEIEIEIDDTRDFESDSNQDDQDTEMETRLPNGFELTFGDYPAYCVTSEVASIWDEPDYNTIGHFDERDMCLEQARAEGYKFIHYWGEDGLCRGLDECPYEYNCLVNDDCLEYETEGAGVRTFTISDPIPTLECDTSINFINGLHYSQVSLTDGCHRVGNEIVCDANPIYAEHPDKQLALEYCQDRCVEKDSCTGFFYQRQFNGHELCGFYTHDFDLNGTWHGHQLGSQVCKKN
jgi:hypothetical protein